MTSFIRKIQKNLRNIKYDKKNMSIEYEVKFLNIKKNNIRKKMKEIGAKLIRPEYLQKRVIFNLPGRNWLRVRDEGDKITMAFKSVTTEENIQGQQEVELEVNDFKTAEDFLSSLGYEKKAYQESKRELWNIDNIEITIDEWPFLEPFIEIEGSSEDEVKKIVKKLNFDYSKGVFGSVGVLYRDKYNISLERISNNTKKVVFNGENPFL